MLEKDTMWYRKKRETAAASFLFMNQALHQHRLGMLVSIRGRTTEGNATKRYSWSEMAVCNFRCTAGYASVSTVSDWACAWTHLFWKWSTPRPRIQTRRATLFSQSIASVRVCCSLTINYTKPLQQTLPCPRSQSTRSSGVFSPLPPPFQKTTIVGLGLEGIILNDSPKAINHNSSFELMQHSKSPECRFEILP